MLTDLTLNTSFQIGNHSNEDPMVSLHRECFFSLNPGNSYNRRNLENLLLLDAAHGNFITSHLGSELTGFISWALPRESDYTHEGLWAYLCMAFCNDPAEEVRHRTNYSDYAEEIGVEDTFVHFYRENLVGLDPETNWNDAYISSIGVDPRYQKNGIGKALYEACEAHLRTLGINRVFTTARLTGGYDLFLASGFLPLVAMRPTHQSGEGSSFMVKILD
jgi:GNAT superfamily N-acetyltransferase